MVALRELESIQSLGGRSKAVKEWVGQHSTKEVWQAAATIFRSTLNPHMKLRPKITKLLPSVHVGESCQYDAAFVAWAMLLGRQKAGHEVGTLLAPKVDSEALRGAIDDSLSTAPPSKSFLPAVERLQAALSTEIAERVLTPAGQHWDTEVRKTLAKHNVVDAWGGSGLSDDAIRGLLRVARVSTAKANAPLHHAGPAAWLHAHLRFILDAFCFRRYYAELDAPTLRTIEGKTYVSFATVPILLGFCAWAVDDTSNNPVVHRFDQDERSEGSLGSTAACFEVMKSAVFRNAQGEGAVDVRAVTFGSSREEGSSLLAAFLRIEVREAARRFSDGVLAASLPRHRAMALRAELLGVDCWVRFAPPARPTGTIDIESSGTSRMGVIKALSKAAGIGIGEAKAAVDARVIELDVDQATEDSIRAALRAAGAKLRD